MTDQPGNDLSARPLPMEAKLVNALPVEPGWQFEPKWDGFRALAFRNRNQVELISKSGKDLGRYFPEIVALLAALAEQHFALDGELILPVGDVLSFDALQQRLHPAASRIAKLSHETPAQFMLFDCLASGSQHLADQPLSKRRAALERFHKAHGTASLLLSPYTLVAEEAQSWLVRSGGALDGVVAKRLGQSYCSGERAMLKVKQHRTADCVVGGFRREKDGSGVASLLLGLYNEASQLDHVGFMSGIKSEDRGALAERLEPLIGGPGFTGKAPGGPSRWNNGEANEWVALRPELVIEVLYDQVTARRFRHGTRLLRWRPDKAPLQCGFDQLMQQLPPHEVAAITGAHE